MMIIVYGRYSKFRLSTSAEIDKLHKRIGVEIDEKKSLESKFLLEAKADSDNIKSLLREVDELRKSKESEMKLRFEAEKQIEMTLQKTNEIQKRMQDWSVVQNAVMKDSKDEIIKIGNDLFKKLNDSYKHENEVNKELLAKFSKEISGSIQKTAALSALNSGDKPKIAATDKSISSSSLNNVIKVMKKSGWKEGENYFLAKDFEGQKAKMFLCDLAFVSLEKLYVVDFKASQYLEEYLQTEDAEVVKQKLDRYLSYLANPKYLSSILKVLSESEAQFDKSGIVIALASAEELKILKDLGYYEKSRKIASEILDFEGLSNLVL